MDLQPKLINDSVIRKLLELENDEDLRKEYANCFGLLRLGKLLELLDKMSADVAYLHTDGLEKGLTIFTAACDRIDILAPLQVTKNMELVGRLNDVGKSSMEVEVSLYQFKEDSKEMVLTSYFVMVATDNGKPVPIAPVKFTNALEEQRSQEAKERKKYMLNEYKNSFEHRPPSASEIAELHQVFLDARENKPLGMKMSKTFRQSTVLMEPQDQNRRGKIFGGYIMRLIYELAWNIAYLSCKSKVIMKNMDHMTFDDPVDIGSVVEIEGKLNYSQNSYFVIGLNVMVVDPLENRQQLTNKAYFIFQAFDKEDQPRDIPSIIPVTYQEGLLYLDAKRRFVNFKNK